MLHPGEVFSLETPGGGGLGNPLERDPERVLNDVRNGYVTQKKAREVYRVAIDAADGDFVLNEAETRELTEQGLGNRQQRTKKPNPCFTAYCLLLPVA